MKALTRVAITHLFLCLALPAMAQRPDALARQEREQAEKDVPQLIADLGLKPSMTVADMGAGSGEMVRVMATRLGPTSRIYATDLTDYSIGMLNEIAMDFSNVTVVRGGLASTNLPESCCDVIYTRNVYHHLTDPGAMNQSLLASLKPGGRLAVIDFEARPGSKLPPGVPANRGGNGIRSSIVEEEVPAAGFVHERTVPDWPAPGSGYFLVVFRKPG